MALVISRFLWKGVALSLVPHWCSPHKTFPSSGVPWDGQEIQKIHLELLKIKSLLWRPRGWKGTQIPKVSRERTTCAHFQPINRCTECKRFIPPKRKVSRADAVSWPTLRQSGSCIARKISQRRGMNTCYKEAQNCGVKKAKGWQWEEADGTRVKLCRKFNEVTADLATPNRQA